MVLGTTAPARTDARPASRGPLRVRTWTLWTNPRPLLVYVLAVDAVALLAVAALATVAVARDDAPTGWQLVAGALLAVGAMVHGAVTRRVERLREVGGQTQAGHTGAYVDLKSLWSFAAVLLLPIWAAVVLVGVDYAYTWLWINRRPPPHRWLFSASANVLATVGAGLVLALAPDGGGPWGLTGLLVVIVAMVLRAATTLLFVVGALSLAAPTTTWRQRFGRRSDYLVELGALALGVALAALATTSPWLVPVLLVPLFTMHRGLLFDQLVRAVRTDEKTGLATSAHWHAEANRLLARDRRHGATTSVLMVDLDHFKSVNDTYGHVTGDRVLRAVADALGPAVRAEDLVARFGGEEFVVLLRDADAATATATAERLRSRVAALSVPGTSVPGTSVPGTPTQGPATVSGLSVSGLSVSVGVATCGPGAPRALTLDDLVLAADGALYSAKRAGRDRVEHAASTV